MEKGKRNAGRGAVIPRVACSFCLLTAGMHLSRGYSVKYCIWRCASELDGSALSTVSNSARASSIIPNIV